jgi:hypothetical protein
MICVNSSFQYLLNKKWIEIKHLCSYTSHKISENKDCQKCKPVILFLGLKLHTLCF